MAEFHSIDGQALTPSSFGQINPATNSWVPIRYTGTYGTNGFYLPFNDATSTTTISQDRSGNGNNWTSSGISVTSGVTFDQMLDSPTNSYATLDPNNRTDSSAVLANANLSYTSGGNRYAASTIRMDSGKWYIEARMASAPSTGQFCFGLSSRASAVGANNDPGFSADTYAFYVPSTAGNRGYWTNSAQVFNVGAALDETRDYKIAVDVDLGRVWLGYDNVWFNSSGATTGDPANNLNPTFTVAAGTPLWAILQTGSSNVGHINFGQRAFAHTPPTGFVALNTANLSTPTISRGDDGFAVVTRAGSASPVSVTGLRFAPDFVWTKSRTTADNHNVADRVRGTSLNLATNLTNAEDTVGRLTAFNSDGYTLAGGAGATNAAGQNFVDWVAREGAAYGFDIAAYAGTGAAQTPTHALNAQPHMMIVKARGAATNPDWFVYHRGIATPQSNRLFLNGTGAATASSAWNNTAPTSSVFSVNTDLSQSGINYVAYLWTSIPGFSLFGSYTGNGSADGPFVWCGFRPRFVMVKNVSAAGAWGIGDAARNPSNIVSLPLFADSANAEGGVYDFDYTANGFKVRNTNVTYNTSGQTYIFAAFAENPFKFANAR
jgi:hypothetical protein